MLDKGWQKFRRFTCLLKDKDAEKEPVQILDSIDWNNLTLGSVKAEEKYTKPPKHFNEASILAFMENPKGESGDKNLAGLGTPATRHTFIPKLLRLNYIEVQKKNLVITKNGEKLLRLVAESPLSAIADIGETTRWEEKLSQNPAAFEVEIKSSSVLQSKEAKMSNLTFLYEENGFTVSKLTVRGKSYFVVQNKTTGQRYIRTSLAVVDSIVRSNDFA